MSLLDRVNPYMTYIKLAGFALALLAAGAAGAYITHNRDQVKYDKLELAQSKAETKSVSASLTQLQGFISKMDGAGADYTAALTVINKRFDQLKKELANATRTPLPPDCKPTADRQRVLQHAIDATRQGAGATQ